MNANQRLFASYQEAFDATVNHLIKQGRRAVYQDRCSYLLQNGDKCAIGAHIPDGHSAQLFVGTVKNMFKAFPDIQQQLMIGFNKSECIRFWDRIQAAHDVSKNLSELKTDLLEIAQEFRINHAVVNGLTSWNANE